MKGPIPNYLKYGFKTTEVAEMYQKEYVPEIEEYIQTSDLPDVTIKVDRCSYTEYNKACGVPVYHLDFTYSSHTVDDYYESAIGSKRGAKDLFYKILEVNGNKNYYENESKIFWDGEPFESEGSDYSRVIELVVADLCTTPVALSAPPKYYGVARPLHTVKLVHTLR